MDLYKKSLDEAKIEYSSKGLNFDTVNSFYDYVIDYFDTADYSPKWKKGIYPYEKMLRDAIENETMHVMLYNGEIISAGILDRHYVKGYEDVPWDKSASLAESLMLHAFCVSPKFMRQGLAKRMLAYFENYAKKQGFLALRLDVIDGNLPALKLYPSAGYKYVCSLELYYEDTGKTLYHMYEKLL